MRIIAALALIVVPGVAVAQPNPWPFDFEAQIAEEPAYVEERLSDLGTGLPGLPAEQMSELISAEVATYYFTEMADALTRAGASGPDMAPPVVRQANMCARHVAFVFPALLAQPSNVICEETEALIAQSLAGAGTTCMQVEFPETYVYEHPDGSVDATVVSSLEGMIALAGDALAHVDFPQGLLPSDLLAMTRTVIAKLRYHPLKADIASHIDSYYSALNTIDTLSLCFDSAAVTTFRASVVDLTAELNLAAQHLDTLYAEGLAEAAIDRLAVEAQGRLRPDLPHPALTDREREMLSFYIGGIYWRMRGHGLVEAPSDGFTKRLYYVWYPFRALTNLNAGVLGDEVATATRVSAAGAWGDWFDMGTNPVGRDKYADLVDMTIRGKEQIALVDPLLTDAGYDTTTLIAGGLQMGVCYFWAWEELPDFRLGEDLQTPYLYFLEGPTAIGEFCAGATLALGLARTLLWGKPDPSYCPPDCVNKECGDDGCGGSCGACLASEVCNLGACVCVPDCASRACGDDGCGGSCGTCLANEECDLGACECVPDCAGRACGDDGCAGVCGSCAANESCTAGACECTDCSAAAPAAGCQCAGGSAAPWLFALLLLYRRQRS